jgi:hypothetical protein
MSADYLFPADFDKIIANISSVSAMEGGSDNGDADLVAYAYLRKLSRRLFIERVTSSAKPISEENYVYLIDRSTGRLFQGEVIEVGTGFFKISRGIWGVKEFRNLENFVIFRVLQNAAHSEP